MGALEIVYCLLFQSSEMPKLTEQLAGPLRQMQVIRNLSELRVNVNTSKAHE